jgi:hypothetical protein
MPLDGLRAWIGEVERKLGMRTRVFLVLAAIAIGGAGAAIYLALDTRDQAVSERDVRVLQDDLEAQIGGGTATGTGLAELEADLRTLEAEVEAMRAGKGGGTGTAAPPAGGGASTEGIGAESGTGSAADLKDILDETRRQTEAAEAQGAESGNAGG